MKLFCTPLNNLLATLGWLAGAFGLATAQPMDRIVAVVDEDVVLLSEVREQYDYMIASGTRDDGTLYCRVLESALTDKLLLARAVLDSLTVPDEQVEQEMNRRLDVMVQQMGGPEHFQEKLGKSIVEFKVEQRGTIREQLLVEQQRGRIYEGVTVSPDQVRTFFGEIPRDSLPFLPAEVEVAQIVLIPQASDANKTAARQRLASILADIQAGSISFEDAARRHSQDRGSAETGGFLGELTRQDVVPEFAEAIFNLGPGQTSGVFESPFGFHVARVHKRQGDVVTSSHILIKPLVDAKDEARCRERLAEIRLMIETGQKSFEQAAREFSADKRTADGGGLISDRGTGSYRIPLDQLDADLYLKIDQLEEGEISQPLELLYQDVQLVRAFQLVQLRRRLPPHRASLETDYEKFQNAAKQARQAEVLQLWFKRNKQNVFIEIKDTDCRQALNDWFD